MGGRCFGSVKQVSILSFDWFVQKAVVLPCPLCDARTTREQNIPVQQCGVEVVEGLLENVLCTQESISATFRDGRRLEDLIHCLKNGDVDPMKDDFLVLKMMKARWHDRRSGRCVTKYYALDHRRLWCMWRAGCSKVRARIELDHPVFDEFARKASRCGTRLEPSAFKYLCSVTQHCVMLLQESQASGS